MVMTGLQLSLFISSAVLRVSRQRQRRIIAPNLNERISMTVWNESCEQAESMLAYLLKGPTNKTLSGLRCLAINVLGRAGYGQHQAWTPQLEDTADEWVDARGAYFKTISLVADMLLIASLFPAWILKLPIWPPAVRSLGAHVEKMPSYTKQMLNEEREFAAEGSSSKDNLLNMLVRFSDQAKEGDAGTSGPSLSLTEDEISGNLFLFSAAGFDTTAHTMGFAVTLLAAYPEWQDWMREELLNIYKEAPHWKYEEVFPRCPRTLAVMVCHPFLHLSLPSPLTDRYIAARNPPSLRRRPSCHPLRHRVPAARVLGEGAHPRRAHARLCLISHDPQRPRDLGP